MKKLKLFFLSVVLLIPAGAFAVAPHPDVIRQWKEDGTLQEKMEQFQTRERIYSESRVSQKTKSLAPQIDPAPSGTYRIPVILIEFPGKSESSTLPSSPISSSLLLIILIGASAPIVFRLRRKGLIHASLACAIIPGLFALSPGCSTSGTSMYGTARFDTVSTPAYYTNLFEGSGRSMKKYYEDMSQDDLHLTFDIYGPYTADYSHDYYGENNRSGNDAHATLLAAEAMMKLIDDQNSAVDFSQYDNDNNGTIDGTIVIHQGGGEEVVSSDTNNDIWSFMSVMSGIEADGVSFSRYSMQPEYLLEPGDSTIGVFCHEFGHILGLPDLYDTTYRTEGAGDWSLMAGGSWNGNNGTIPAPLLAWERYQMGWLTYDTAVNGSNTVVDIDTSYKATKVLLHTESASGVSGQQYLLVENIVKKAGSWTEGLPGEGLLITKIDDWWISKTSDLNLVNGASLSGTYLNIHGVTVVQNGGNTLWTTELNGSNGGTEYDTFKSGAANLTTIFGWPSSLRSTNYTDYTSLNSFPSFGYTKSSNVILSGFSVVGSSMSFTCSGL